MKKLITISVVALAATLAPAQDALDPATNSPPVVVVKVINEVRVPLILDIPNNYYVLSPHGEFAEVFFDASGSYDPDGDQLSFGWRYWDDGWSTLRPTARTSGLFGPEDDYRMVLSVSDGANVFEHEFTLLVVEPYFLIHSMLDFLWQETGNEKRYFPLGRMLNRSADAYEALHFTEGTHFLNAFTEELRHEKSLRLEAREALIQMAQTILGGPGR